MAAGGTLRRPGHNALETCVCLLPIRKIFDLHQACHGQDSDQKCQSMQSPDLSDGLQQIVDGNWSRRPALLQKYTEAVPRLVSDVCGEVYNSFRGYASDVIL